MGRKQAVGGEEEATRVWNIRWKPRLILEFLVGGVRSSLGDD